MSKESVSSHVTVYAGIDVSAATLAVAVQREDRTGFEQRQLANSAMGHKQLIGWLLKCGGIVRVSLEATGIYSLDVALALVGVRFDPYLKAFYLHLQARHKTKLQALMAVSRKLLHAIFGIFKNVNSYDGAKLFPALGAA